MRVPLPRWLASIRWGAAGLTASAGVAGWVEFTLLRRTLNARIGATGAAGGTGRAKLWGSAAVGAAAAWGIKLRVGLERPVLDAIAIVGTYGVVYFGATFLLGVEECRGLLRRVIPSDR